MLTLEEKENVKTILRNGIPEGTVRKLNGQWEYTNSLNVKGSANTEYAAFVQLGFKIATVPSGR